MNDHSSPGIEQAGALINSAYDELCVRFSGVHSDDAMDSVLLRLHAALKKLGIDPTAPYIATPLPDAAQRAPDWDAHHNRSYEPVETRAKEIYDFFEFREAGSKPAWVPGGNSLMQDEARICARKQLREAGHTPPLPSTNCGGGK